MVKLAKTAKRKKDKTKGVCQTRRNNATTFFFATFYFEKYRETNGTKKKVVAFWGDYYVLLRICKGFLNSCHL